MNLKFEDEVHRDLDKIDKELEKRILREIFKLEDNPPPDNSYVIHLLDGTKIQCLKLQEEDRNSELNHRATYDIVDNQKIRIYGIFRRNPGYQEIKEKTQRRRDQNYSSRNVGSPSSRTFLSSNHAVGFSQTVSQWTPQGLCPG